MKSKSIINDHNIRFTWHPRDGHGPVYSTVHDDLDKAKENLWRYLVENNQTAGHENIDLFIVETLPSWEDIDHVEDRIIQVPRYDAH